MYTKGKKGEMCLVHDCWQHPRPDCSPVLVELPLDLVAKMLCPHSVERSKASGGRDIANNAHHNHGGCLNDGHSLQPSSADQRTRSRSVELQSWLLNQA